MAKRMVCKRNMKVILKQAFWIVIWIQLFFICLLVVSFRDDKTRVRILSHFGNGTDKLVFNSSPDRIPHLEGIEKSWKFKKFDVDDWERNQWFSLSDTERVDSYFRPHPKLHSVACFVEGTDFSKNSEQCSCLPDYFGADCGIPAAVWHGHFGKVPRDRKRLKRRTKPRRLIHGVLLNHEFDFFESRVRTLEDVVDAYIVQESNFTTFGSGKELLFLQRFKEGWLKDQQDKFVYVPLRHFTERGENNGWYADAYIRRYLSKHGMKLIGGQRDDDLFLLLDADELPTREVLLFLKLYDGYTEPIRFGFRWTIFGFFWLKDNDPSMWSSVPLFGQMFNRRSERLLQLYVLSTVGMLSQVYGNNAMLLRRNVWKDKLLEARVQNYTRQGHVIKEWEAGTIGHYAGFHCSWCYSPEGIRTKLLSAQKDDSPRWGDFPEKTDLNYIRELIRTGGWFDDTRPFIEVIDKEQKFYAPKYLLDNKERFLYLLEKPTQNDTIP